MTKNVLFVQGAGAGAYDVDRELVSSLTATLGPDYDVRYPAMPNEDSPDDTVWKQRLGAEVDRAGEGAILVAHSAGASALVRTLAERASGARPAGIFLIAAAFCGEGGWQIDGCDTPSDLSDRLPHGVPVFLYQGSDDETVPPAHVDLYAKLLPDAVIRRFPGRNHQLDGDLSDVATDIKQLPPN